MPATHEVRAMASPDQSIPMTHGKLEVITINGGPIARATFEPGWKWSAHEKPALGVEGDHCSVPHFVYVVSGQIHIALADGGEYDIRAGDIATIPAGHDGWVVGDETAVMVDFGGVARPF